MMWLYSWTLVWFPEWNEILDGDKNTNGNDPLELFPFRRRQISSPTAPGYGYHGWLHLFSPPACAFRYYFCCPSLLDSAFYGVTLLLSLRFSFRITFPDGVSDRIQCGASLAIGSAAVRTIRAFQPSCSPGYLTKLSSPFSPGPKLNLQMNVWRFFRLTEQSDHLLLSNLWLFRCANPRVWMIRFLTHLSVSPLLHIFRVTFYRLPDDIKIQHKTGWIQIFSDFCINHVSTFIINNCL